MMSLGLITRVKINYSFGSLLKALFVSESSDTLRKQCKSILAKYYGDEAVCLTPSARDGIFELLIRLPQKKVVVPAYTCMVVVEAVLLAGKEIVFAPTDMTTFNSGYLECITHDCIVLATHQYGLPCDIKSISKKCKEVGAVLIEDCATSMGTTIDGQMTGTFGDYAVVSFNASKTLTVPPVGGLLIGKNRRLINDIDQTAEWEEGGWKFKVKGLIRGLIYVLTTNHFIYKCFHWLTIDRKDKLQRTEHDKPSEVKTDNYTIRFAEWQASILLDQLNKLNDILKRRKEIYANYDERIINPLVKKPMHDRNAVCTRYAIMVEDRKVFYKACIAKGVDMDFSHCSIGCPDSFCEEHKAADEVMNLPFYYNLSDKEMDKVVRVVNSITLSELNKY